MASAGLYVLYRPVQTSRTIQHSIPWNDSQYFYSPHVVAGATYISCCYFVIGTGVATLLHCIRIVNNINNNRGLCVWYIVRHSPIRAFPQQSRLLAILPAGGGRETERNREKRWKTRKEWERVKRNGEGEKEGKINMQEIWNEKEWKESRKEIRKNKTVIRRNRRTEQEKE